MKLILKTLLSSIALLTAIVTLGVLCNVWTLALWSGWVVFCALVFIYCCLIFIVAGSAIISSLIIDRKMRTHHLDRNYRRRYEDLAEAVTQMHHADILSTQCTDCDGAWDYYYGLTAELVGISHV